MPYIRSKISAKKLRKLMKEKGARAKAELSDGSLNEKLETTEPQVVSRTVECSGGILDEGLCDATEPEVASGSVYDHNLELRDVTEYVVASTADDATEPDAPSDPSENNDGSVCDHNLQLCDIHSLKLLLLLKISEIDS